VNLLDAFHARCAAHPDRTALIDPRGRAHSYAELAARAEALAAHWHKAGLRQGDRVLIAVRLDADLYAALAALWRLGAVAVLPEPALGRAGLMVALAAAKPRAVLLGGLFRLLPLIVPALWRVPLRLPLTGSNAPPPVADLPDDAPALISFTTGSTGIPKGIVRSHGFMRAQEAAVTPLIGTGGVPSVDLVGFPVFVVANLGQGVTSVLPDWPPRRIDRATGSGIAALIERHDVKRLLLSPALVGRLASVGVPPYVDAIFTGGGPVFPKLLKRLAEQRPDCRVIAVYGSTEAEPIAEIALADISADDFTEMESGGGLLAGTPVAGLKLRLVDDEIQVAGAHVVSGYLDPARDSETKLHDRDGTCWHRTGDAGRMDSCGRLWLLGRHGGRVAGHWPFAVEVAAQSWSGVSAAALIDIGRNAVLAIAGDAANLPQWRSACATLGIGRLCHLRAIPRDARHGSKVDVATLRSMIETRGRIVRTDDSGTGG